MSLNQVNQKNIIIVLGDLGAGINFVKNTLLLSPDVDFAWQTIQSRVNFIVSSVYPSNLKEKPNNWIKHEYQLRSWKKIYGVDIADSYNDIDTESVRQVSQNKKIVFICHWPDIVNKIKKLYPDINIISLYAATDEELEWQVSQYISKIGIQSLHNFSFEGNIQQQKEKYIFEHGIDAYQKFNALNMLEILKGRKNEFNRKDYKVLNIRALQSDSWVEDIAQHLNITIDAEQAHKLSTVWRELNPSHIKYWN